jgi:hypothetical protein
VDYQNVIDVINKKIDMDKSRGSGIQTAGWIPGHNWTGTVYESILTVCDSVEDLAGKLFGIIEAVPKCQILELHPIKTAVLQPEGRGILPIAGRETENRGVLKLQFSG